MARVRVATLALCLFGALGAVAPALASAGAIWGTVTAENGGAPIAGVEVCPTPQPYTFEAACVETNASGAYQLNGLPEASYSLRFSGDRNNLPYVNEFYGNKESFPGDLIQLGGDVALSGIDAQLSDGSTIAGTVTDAGSAGPVANFLVCAFAPTALGEVGRCDRTEPSGSYAINGLPPEDYKVEFLSEDEFNYLPQYYDGVDTLAAATPVSIVAAKEVKAGIDAALLPGVEITGTLTEVGSGKPLAGVDVSLLKAGTEKSLGFPAKTDSAGRYAFRGRPTGTYVVGFSHTLGGSFNGDCYSAQYYKGSVSFSGATPLTVTAPSVIPGIDGQVVDICPKPPDPQPVKVTFIPTDPPRPPFKCKKNQRKKWVKGKQRCVKKPRKHGKTHHGKKGQGPQAVATER
ncbi:MAG TPA: carboxypeptidase-like regulatory domain-containing protein [Solirubrobacterales bacterium]|nr:carboxypeptidase-like regulatory domain-containing protein [Solirubrobacterales bacterium]